MNRLLVVTAFALLLGACSVAGTKTSIDRPVGSANGGLAGESSDASNGGNAAGNE